MNNWNSYCEFAKLTHSPVLTKTRNDLKQPTISKKQTEKAFSEQKTALNKQETTWRTTWNDLKQPTTSKKPQERPATSKKRLERTFNEQKTTWNDQHRAKNDLKRPTTSKKRPEMIHKE